MTLVALLQPPVSNKILVWTANHGRSCNQHVSTHNAMELLVSSQNSSNRLRDWMTHLQPSDKTVFWAANALYTFFLQASSEPTRWRLARLEGQGGFRDLRNLQDFAGRVPGLHDTFGLSTCGPPAITSCKTKAANSASKLNKRKGASSLVSYLPKSTA